MHANPLSTHTTSSPATAMRRRGRKPLTTAVLLLATAATTLAGAAGTHRASAAFLGSTLGVGGRLNPGDYLSSPSGAYTLWMQSDGNLVEYAPGNRPLWASYTAGNNGAFLVNQSDGNLVIYAPSTWIWASNTAGRGAANLVVQDDGNVVAYGPAGATWTTYTAGGVSRMQAVGAVAFARAQLGKPYVYGATGPNAYDCSGLTLAAYASVGIGLPRTSQQQWSVGTPVSALQPGDLVFFNPTSTGPSHVGIYIGNGQMIDAPRTGAYVRIDNIAGFGTYLGARRVS
jgi:cell wall-associated NlpC family hydrolase